MFDTILMRVCSLHEFAMSELSRNLSFSSLLDRDYISMTDILDRTVSIISFFSSFKRL